MSDEINFSIYIPARLNSSRLPRKLLLPLAGKAVICHTIDRALEAKPEHIVVVTDSDEIASCVRSYQSLLGDADRELITIFRSLQEHESGTDRIAEAAAVLGVSSDQIIVNLQGDEPLLPASHIAKVVSALAESSLLTATLSVPINSEEADNLNNVKVVTNKDSSALYFSRSKIPFDRDEQIVNGKSSFVYQKHLGLYAYRGELLKTWPSLQESVLENLEKLEQLRLLENNLGIQVAAVEEFNGVGIDTKEQLGIAERLISGVERNL